MVGLCDLPNEIVDNICNHLVSTVLMNYERRKAIYSHRLISRTWNQSILFVHDKKLSHDIRIREDYVAKHKAENGGREGPEYVVGCLTKLRRALRGVKRCSASFGR